MSEVFSEFCDARICDTCAYGNRDGGYECEHKWLAEHDAKVRAEAIDEVLSSMHEMYAHNLYCLADMCERDERGYDCEDCMYRSLSGMAKLLKEQKNG